MDVALDPASVEESPGPSWCAAWTERVDRALRERMPDSGGLAVVALGSYARAELCPASDIDLLLLHDGWRHRDLEELVRALCYPLWDAGLAVGYAVRTAREAIDAAEAHVESATALTDRRLVAGDAGLADDLAARYARWLRHHGSGLLAALAAADADRHVRAAAEAGRLEPDLKRGAGGLRDLHSLRWAAACLLGEQGLDPLVSARYLGVADVPALRNAARMLLAVRCALQLHQGRTVPGTTADRLTLESQDAVATLLGMTGGDRLLRAVNLSCRRIAHVHGRAWPHMVADAQAGRSRERPAPEPLDDGVLLVDGVVEVEPGRELAADQSLGLRALAAAAARGRHLGRESASRLSRELGELRALRWTPEARGSLLAILRHGPDALPALADADAIGLLAALLPDWRRVRGTPQRNPYHLYDLDTHLMQAVAELGRVAAGTYDQRHATVWEGLDEPDVVLLATWLHDIGKAYAGDHSIVGAQLSRDWLLRMGFGPRRADRVGKLVRLHLLLPERATGRDLDDDDEIDSVAELVGDAETLDGLYLLALADGKATGPTADSAWRAELIGELHARVRTRLTGDAEETRALTGPEAVRAQARQLAGGVDVDAVLTGMPRRYLLATRPEQVAAHARLLAERDGAERSGAGEGRSGRAGAAEGPVASIRDGHAPGTRVLSLVAEDRLGLMADVAGVLASGGLVVLEARAFTRGDGLAFDWFVVTGQAPCDDGALIERVVAGAAGKRDVARLVAAREATRGLSASAAARHVPVEVAYDRGPLLTRVEVRGPDAPGTLYRLGRVLAEERIDVVGARVATLGPEVRDVFFVRPSGGPPDWGRLADRLEAAATPPPA